MRGDKEQNCLDLIKQEIFMNDGSTILHPFNGKTYTEVDDDTFTREQSFFISNKCHKSYFGLLKEDRNEIEQILRVAKPNAKKSEFPDFIFKYGLIEHFQVSSSKTTRKGAEHIKKMNCFVSNVNKEKESIIQKRNEISSYDEVHSKHWIMDNPEHSHSFLIKSFKDNWKNHINSLNSYTGKKDVAIFIIEYSDNALSMLEDVYEGWIDGMSQGDMREQEKFSCYRLTRDKELLNFIYKYKNEIKYTIFVYQDGFEIISLVNIPYLLKLMPWEYKIFPMMVKNISSLYRILI